MKIKTHELLGAALDWAVARVEKQVSDDIDDFCLSCAGELAFSTDWALAGPIIEREGISTRKIVSRGGVFEVRHFDASKGDVIFRDEAYKRDMVRRPPQGHVHEGMWLAKMPIGTGSNDRWASKEHFLSSTALIAAMRCYVASKLGAEVDIPDELAGAPKPKTATQRYNETTFCVFGRRLSSSDLHAGLLVRYDSGSTALMTLRSPHAGGWHGAQCMGGTTFAHDSFYEATALDREIWDECAKWRKS